MSHAREPRFFFSGRYSTDTFLGYKQRKDLTPCVLFSFAEVYSGRRVETEVLPMVEGGVELMLDSGAFSVFTGTAVVNRETYTRFAETHGHLFSSIAALDVIGDPQASWDNYVWQRSRVPVFPVFHLGEPWPLFDDYVTANPELVGIGGVAGDKAKGPQTMALLHEAFRRVADPGEVPRVPIHGFAMGLGHVTRALPWHSADSATAVRASGGGRLMLYKDGEMLSVMVRDDRLVMGNRHLSAVEVEWVERRLAEHNTTLHEVMEYSAPRTAINVLEMRRLADDIPRVYTPAPESAFLE